MNLQTIHPVGAMVPIARWIAKQFCVLAHGGQPCRPPHSIFKNPNLCRDALRHVRSGQSPALSHKTPAFAHSILGVISLMHWITQVEVDGDFGLKLRFQDGSLRRVNLRDHLDGAMFAPLKDPGSSAPHGSTLTLIPSSGTTRRTCLPIFCAKFPPPPKPIVGASRRIRQEV